ncbi:Uncharacterized protein DBV15_02713 [Temnothorax longispinosus]|uniref:Uncharacterized protein n=1 Tax=Temnothorax longispinosus TaxID=300112 RepID=A0A4S2KAW3_9HYME|nr:Uncharacterized protein DBV15_02713 [Temnothorax longispinosus]
MRIARWNRRQAGWEQIRESRSERVSIVEMSWTATGGGKRSNKDDMANKATALSPLVPRSAGGRGDRSCLQARRTGSMAVKAHAGSWQLRRAKFSTVTNCFPACRRR